MKTCKTLSTLLLCVIFSTAVHAAAQLDELMQRSGINQQIEQMQAHIDISLQQAQDGLPDATLTAMGNIMYEQFAAEKLKASVRSRLQQQLSSRDIKTVLAWLDSPLGKKITEQEVAASTPDAYLDMLQIIDQLLSDSERFTLIRKLDEVTGASKATLSMTLSMQKAITYGMLAAEPDSSISEQQIQQVIQEMEPQLRSQMELMVLTSMIYTYRKLSDTELNRYIEFASSSAGKNYHQAFVSALSEAMNAAGSAVGKEIVRMQAAD